MGILIALNAATLTVTATRNGFVASRRSDLWYRDSLPLPRGVDGWMGGWCRAWDEGGAEGAETGKGREGIRLRVLKDLFCFFELMGKEIDPLLRFVD